MKSRAIVNCHPSRRRVAGDRPHYSCVVYTIFLSSETENTTFAIGRRERKWYFRSTRQKKKIVYAPELKAKVTIFTFYGWTNTFPSYTEKSPTARHRDYRKARCKCASSTARERRCAWDHRKTW